MKKVIILLLAYYLAFIFIPDFRHVLYRFWWWIEVHTGTVNEPGPYYGFWSGFGSVFVTPSIFAGMYMYYKQNQCHEDNCHRWGKYPFQHYKLCKVHHPDVPDKITHAHLLELHKRAKLTNNKYER
jgi:hypothetical protein